MPDLKQENVERYLEGLLGQPVEVLVLAPLGESAATSSVKGYGYGTPVQVDYVANGQRQRRVLHTLSPGSFGHEHMADRAQVLLWEHQAFNRLPRHVRSVDVGGLEPDGKLISLGNIKELFLETTYAEGQGYFLD